MRCSPHIGNVCATVDRVISCGSSFFYLPPTDLAHFFPQPFFPAVSRMPASLLSFLWPQCLCPLPQWEPPPLLLSLPFPLLLFILSWSCPHPSYFPAHRVSKPSAFLLVKHLAPIPASLVHPSLPTVPFNCNSTLWPHFLMQVTLQIG